MGDLQTPLPEYDNPPVSEVVFGVQFEELGIKAPDTGILWEKLGRKVYPECKAMPPLPYIIEGYDSPTTQPQEPIVKTFTQPPLPRLFFISVDKSHLVQVQQDRFHQNWRRVQLNEQYPRYATLYPKFKKSWKLFGSFVTELNLGKLEPRQYELTYVNHIPRGKGWANLSDVERVFPEFKCKTGDHFLPEPENIFWRRTYRFANESGRLHVSLRLAVSREVKDRIMVLELTARGFANEGMDSWFDMGHEWIVRGFSDLTSRTIQDTIWKRKR